MCRGHNYLVVKYLWYPPGTKNYAAEGGSVAFLRKKLFYGDKGGAEDSIVLHFCYFRYRDFRDNEGNLTAFYWHLLALKLGFVIVFEVRILFLPC